MSEDINSQQLADIVQKAMRDFRVGAEKREALSVRIGRKTTQIIRAGMVGMFILGFALFYLIAALSDDFGEITTSMKTMTTHMVNMDRNFSDVANRMQRMDDTLMTMSQAVQVMPTLGQGIRAMNQNTLQMASDLNSLAGYMAGMQRDVNDLNGQIRILNRQVNGINSSMQHMTGSMNNMSRPLDYFPF